MKDGSYACAVFCLDFRGALGIVDLTIALKGENGLVVTTALFEHLFLKAAQLSR